MDCKNSIFPVNWNLISLGIGFDSTDLNIFGSLNEANNPKQQITKRPINKIGIIIKIPEESSYIDENSKAQNDIDNDINW